MSTENKYLMDELLRQRLKDASAHVPEGMWARIEDARKTRRVHPYGWAGFSALILVTAAFAGWVTYSESHTQIAEPVQVATLETQLRNNQETANATTSNLETIDELSGSTSGENIDKAATINTLNKSGSVQTTQDALSSKGLTSKDLNAAENNRSNRTNRKNTAELRKENTVDSPSTDESQLIEETSAEPLASAQTDRHIANLKQLALPGFDGVEKSSQTEANNSSVSKFLGLGSGKKGSPSCYAFNSFLRGLSIDAYMAPEYAARQLVYKEPGMIDYAALRNDTESYSFAFSMGMRVNAHFKGGLALRTGLIYTDIAEKLRFTDPNSEVTKIITINIDTIYDGPNQIIQIDTLSVVEFGQHEKIGYNRYRFFDVPLILAYEIERGRWIIHLNTGVMLNVATAQRGNFLDPESNLVSINSNGPDSYPAFRKKVGTSLLMSLGFNYAVKPKLHVLLEPQLRVWMSPLNIKDYPVDQKYVNIGLALGLRQYF